MYVITT